MKKRLLCVSLTLLLLFSACSAPVTPTGISTGTNTSATGTTTGTQVHPTGTTVGNLDKVTLAVMGDASPMPGYDAQNKYAYMGLFSFQETDTFFFGSSFGEDHLHYYDKATGISDYLCADPTCTHDGQTCGAFFESGASAFYYNGQRWWIARNKNGGTDFYLYRSDISGLNQEQVKRIDYRDVVLTYQPQQYAIHRGNLFVLGAASVVDGAEIKTRYSLLASPLDGTEEFAILFDQTLDIAVRRSVQFVGTKVYYTMQSWDASRSAMRLTIQSYDLAARVFQTEFTDLIEEDMRDPWVTEQGEIYIGGRNRTENTVHLWKVENGKRVEVVSLTAEKSQQPYITDGVAVIPVQEDQNYGIAVVDFSGNTLLETDVLFSEPLPGIEEDIATMSCFILGGDREKIIMHLSGEKENHVVLIDIRDGVNIVRLWSSGE